MENKATNNSNETNKWMDRTEILSLSLEELTAHFAGMGEKAFRAGQVYQWLHEKQAQTFEEMTNLSKKLREQLGELFVLEPLHEETVQISRQDGTRKYLFLLKDGHAVESVWMKYRHGNSVCISTQVGCRMGCRFCASAIGGLTRNLSAAEMLAQVYQIQRSTGERISNIVLMGTGEPLDNYEEVLRFLRLITHPKGQNLSQRNITLSTCGLVEGIRRLAGEQLQITLAISLHAPTDEKRRQIMPVANRYSLAEIKAACQYYFDQTGRRVSFEYSLIMDVNDREEEVHQLGTYLKGMNCHVNLIPINPVKERDFQQSRKKNVLNFKNKLEKYGINVTIRREMGQDIDGACGQLRKSYREKNEENLRLEREEV